MPSTVQRLAEKKLISPPAFLPNNIHMEVMIGSVAYGVSSDTSDVDLFGFCVPPKEVVFPHIAGELVGFGRQKKRFEQFQKHGIQCNDDLGGKGRVYDLTIYNILKYFQLCMDGNPNLLDSLFVPQNCVLHITQVGNLVRENRNLFVHKGCFHKMKGYAFSQLHKAQGKNVTGKRKELREKYGFDTKFLYHVVRLLDECEQLLETGDMDLQRNKEQLKAIRRGEMKPEEVVSWFNNKEKQLEKLYHTSKIPHSPDEGKIKQLLLTCLEMHYGSLSEAEVAIPDKEVLALKEIREVLSKYNL